MFVGAVVIAIVETDATPVVGAVVRINFGMFVGVICALLLEPICEELLEMLLKLMLHPLFDLLFE